MSNLIVIAKNVLNVYSEPSSSEEMVTQALMGQPAWIVEESNDWAKVQTWDGYSGWALRKWLIERPDGQEYASAAQVGVVRELIVDVHERADPRSEIITKAVISTTLEMLGHNDDWAVASLPGGKTGHLKGTSVYLTARDKRLPPLQDTMVLTAKRFIGVPYLWGGTSPFGIDCSGFTQLVYRIHGVNLLRNSRHQAEDSRARPVERQELSLMDLVFFAGGDDKERITHVGMWVGEGRFIHSAGGDGVIISRLDEERYSSVYYGARRIIQSPQG